MDWATRRITARELYDLAADSMETVNLAPRAEVRSILEQMEVQRDDSGLALPGPRMQSAGRSGTDARRQPPTTRSSRLEHPLGRPSTLT
jgi:hypothetical protein